MPKICSLIVTYNRKELLLRCIEHCLEQNINTDILIFDNFSTDGTCDYLMEKGLLNNERIIYHRATENLGGSGGFSNGLKIAYKKGYDYIWLMDDDGYPRDEFCLEECLKLIDNNKSNLVIINALVLGSDGNTMSFRTANYSKKDKLLDDYPDGKLPNAISPFNGTLISRMVIEKIGYPRADFFIKGDETEYTWRAKANGVKLITATRAEFIHPVLMLQKKKILFYEYYGAEESYWKEYYRARNYVYIYKTYSSKFQLFKHVVRTLINCITYKEDVKRKRYYLLKGLKDGFNNKFENISF